MCPVWLSENGKIYDLWMDCDCCQANSSKGRAPSTTHHWLVSKISAISREKQLHRHLSDLTVIHFSRPNIYRNWQWWLLCVWLSSVDLAEQKKNICTLTPVGPDQASLLPPTQYEPQLDPSWESIRGRSGGVIYSTITTPVATGQTPKKGHAGVDNPCRRCICEMPWVFL